MKPPKESSLFAGREVRFIEAEAQAKVVTDRLELRRLAPFMGQECSMSQAAAALGLRLPAAFKLVRRYLHLGLLEEVRAEKRGGRPIRYYRAPAAFFVPFALRPLDQIGQQNRAAQLDIFEGNLSRAMREGFGSGWGSLSAFTPSGEVYYELVSEEGEFFDPQSETSPLILSGWNRFSLSHTEARELQKKLMDVLDVYLSRTPAPEDALERQTYQLGVFLARDYSADHPKKS